MGVHCDEHYGPGGVVTGIVLDSLNAAPLDSARVSINGCRVETDEQGRFLFVGIDPGTRYLSAYKPGWQGRSEAIESILGDNTRVMLRLARKPGCNPAEYPELPRIESGGARIRLRLDDPLQAALDSVAPGFVPYGLDAYADGIASDYELECYQAPSAVLGDFNADGVSDLFAVGRSEDQGVYVVLISSAEGYVATRESREGPGGGGLFTYYVREESDGEIVCLDEGPLDLTAHAVHELIDEKASVLHYWRDGEWRECATSD